MPSPIPIRPTSPLPPLHPPPAAASVAAAVGASQPDTTSSNGSGGTAVIGGGGRPTIIGAPHVALLASFNAAQLATSDTNPTGTAASSNAAEAVNFADDTNFNGNTNFNEDTNDAIAQIAADNNDNKLYNELDEDTTTQNTTNAGKSNDTNNKAKNGNVMAVGKPNPV